MKYSPLKGGFFISKYFHIFVNMSKLDDRNIMAERRAYRDYEPKNYLVE